MSSTTPRLGLTKPAQGEQYNVDITNANFQAVDTAIAALQDGAETSGVVDLTSGLVQLTPAAYTCTLLQVVTMGKLVQADVQIKRIGATQTAGNVANVDVTTLAAAYRPLLTTGLVPSIVGGGANIAVSPNGIITVSAVEIDWPINGVNSFSGIWMIP